MGKILGRKEQVRQGSKHAISPFSTNLSEGFVTQNANNKSFRRGEHGPWDRSEGGSDRTAKNIIERPNARRLLFFIAHYGRPSFLLSLPKFRWRWTEDRAMEDPIRGILPLLSREVGALNREIFRPPCAALSVGRPVFLLHRIAEDGKKVMAGDGRTAEEV